MKYILGTNREQVNNIIYADDLYIFTDILTSI